MLCIRDFWAPPVVIGQIGPNPGAAPKFTEINPAPWRTHGVLTKNRFIVHANEKAGESKRPNGNVGLERPAGIERF